MTVLLTFICVLGGVVTVLISHSAGMAVVGFPSFIWRFYKPS